MNRLQQFLDAVVAAADLNEGEPPPEIADAAAEYLRGQAELICSMFGVNTDHKDAVAGFIRVLAGVQRN